MVRINFIVISKVKILSSINMGGAGMGEGGGDSMVSLCNPFRCLLL